jgi:hypothetical protein
MVDASRSVFWLEPAAWEHQRAIVVLQTFAIDEWLAIIHQYRYPVAILAEEASAPMGPGVSGQVLAVETGSRQFFLLPPEALAVAADLLSPADNAILQARMLGSTGAVTPTQTREEEP